MTNQSIVARSYTGSTPDFTTTSGAGTGQTGGNPKHKLTIAAHNAMAAFRAGTMSRAEALRIVAVRWCSDSGPTKAEYRREHELTAAEVRDVLVEVTQIESSHEAWLEATAAVR